MSDGLMGALAAQVAMNTTISAATGGLTVFMLRYAILKKYDVGGLCNGILAGLVSITAPCGNVESGSAFAIGLIGGIVYQAASMFLQKLEIDDPVDASPVHGFCGIWGCLAQGLFDWGKGFDTYHGWSGFSCMPVSETDSTCQSGIAGTALGAQCILVIMVILWAGSLSGIAFFCLKMTGKLRIDEDTEEVGMDVKQHSPPKAYAIGQALSKEKQVEQGTTELTQVLTGKTVVFNDYSWGGNEPQESIEEKMQKAWNASEREENHALIKEVAAVLKKYPSLQLRLKGISSGRGMNNHVTEAAFSKDYSTDFPDEPMDKREPYAHGRVLSIKRMLKKEGIKADRLISEIVVASGSKVEMSVE
ncbi:AMT1-3 [Symbiodinium natans]|uniref:AMT1-3 protein n=1 Tax=Symbiodinium natans TaxID=878477 RepID=A0A812LFZ8_9DINO|nr:AMT1-3 [Symbiodinium natans]